MEKTKPRIGQKGAAREITKMLTELRKRPLPKELFEIAEGYYKRKQQEEKEQKPPVKTKSDLDV